jgi:hypothetical protein
MMTRGRVVPPSDLNHGFFDKDNPAIGNGGLVQDGVVGSKTYTYIHHNVLYRRLEFLNSLSSALKTRLDTDSPGASTAIAAAWSTISGYPPVPAAGVTLTAAVPPASVPAPPTLSPPLPPVPWPEPTGKTVITPCTTNV